MSIAIKPESFTPAKAAASEVGEHYAKLINGSVEVKYGNATFKTWAIRYEDGDISVLGFIGRYRTSNKPWRVSLRLSNGFLSCWFGRDERSGAYSKRGGITFEPSVFYAA
jgi:hypothetical protein